jgi:hypothetical protein
MRLISASYPVSWAQSLSPAGDRSPLAAEADVYQVPVRFALGALQSRGLFWLLRNVVDPQPCAVRTPLRKRYFALPSDDGAAQCCLVYLEMAWQRSPSFNLTKFNRNLPRQSSQSAIKYFPCRSLSQVD